MAFLQLEEGLYFLFLYRIYGLLPTAIKDSVWGICGGVTLSSRNKYIKE
jgi:hypothetical protein